MAIYIPTGERVQVVSRGYTESFVQFPCGTISLVDNSDIQEQQCIVN